jgi:hypothetical protein
LKCADCSMPVIRSTSIRLTGLDVRSHLMSHVLTEYSSTFQWLSDDCQNCM